MVLRRRGQAPVQWVFVLRHFLLMATRIRKAVFPVAGLGTRFLPATKAVPKEALPIVDKPLIQYAVEEAVAAGIDQLIFITGRNKRSIPDHFDMAYELEAELEASGKTEQLEQVRKITLKASAASTFASAKRSGWAMPSMRGAGRRRRAVRRHSRG